MNKKYKFNKSRSIFSNRKGMFSDIQMAILAVAAILIMVIFANKVYIGMRDKLATNSCKDSIEAHSILASGTDGQVFTDIKCPTKEIRIKSLKTANSVIAEDMHRCWYMWGRGEKRLFEGEGTFCHICSTYRFEDPDRQVDGFVNYLSTTPIKVKYIGDKSGISYMDYFQGFSTPNSASQINKGSIEIPLESDYLDTSQKYSTIFVYVSGKDAITKLTEGGTKVAAYSGGGLTVAAGTAATVYGTIAAGSALVTALSAGGTFAAANFWNPLGWIVGGTTAVVAGGYVIYLASSSAEPEWTSFIVLRPYSAEDINALGCQKIDVNQQSDKGLG